MHALTEDLLRQLAQREAPICLSVFLETAVGGGEHDKNRIALKNARKQAAEALDAAGADKDAAGAVLARLDAVEPGEISGVHDGGVALFVTPDSTEVVSVSGVRAEARAGRRFHLAPLLGAVDATPEHAVLVATQGHSALYRAAHGHLQEETVEGLPESIADFKKFTDMQETGNVKGREDAGISHHSMGGDWRLDKEDDFRLYAHQLAKVAGHHLGGTGRPLVIAADERLHGAIREHCDYPDLVEEGITLNPDDLDKDKLRTEAARCLSKAIEARRADAWEQVEAALGRGDGKASKEPAEIVTAAASGRVAILFADTGAHVPGRIDSQTLAAEAAADGKEDLVDAAVVETLRNGGEVHPLGDRGEGRMRIAAAYRY